MRKPCTNCSENIYVEQEEIDDIIKQLIEKKNIKVVDEETYSQRLSKCFDCQAFAFGETCMYCGCLVQVRAKIADKHCPYPLERKW